jgi:hypothetical protein
MTLFITFFNLIALIVFLVGGLHAFATFVRSVIEVTSPGHEFRTLVSSYHGRVVTYPWVERSILPCIALMWLVSAYLTDNLLP